MALAALISACRAADLSGDDAAGVLRASVPLAGGTVIEHQARLAAAAGAGPIIILVERLPAALTAAVDRLRRDGLRVEIARGLADAVDRIHPDEALLVIADGCVAGGDIVRRVAGGPLPAVLTVPDDADHARFERIDAAARWGGLLLIDGARLRKTAAMLGEWDLESTLLRRAVQEGAARIGAFDDGDAPLAIVERGADGVAIERALAAVPRDPLADWPARFLFPPLVDLAAMPLLRRGVEPQWLAVAATALALLAAPLMLFGWRWTALSLLLLSGPVAALGGRLADVRHAPIHRGGSLAGGRVAGAAATLLLAAGELAETLGWGCWLVALLVPAAMGLLARERRVLAMIEGPRPPPWIASLDGLIWLFLPAAVAGMWLGGIALLAGYAALSLIAVQRLVIRTLAGGAV